jgi:spore maturation protein CgeB
MVHPGPSFSVADVYHGLCRGLRDNGCQVARFNFDDRLELFAQFELVRDGERRRAFAHEAAIVAAADTLDGMLYRWWPDVVVIVSGFFIPPATWRLLRHRPHHVVYWATETPYEDERQFQPAECADTVIVNDPATIDAYRVVNPRTWYIPHSYDPLVHCPGPPDPGLVCDFGWVGTGMPSRQRFFSRVDWTGLDVKLGGNWQLMGKRSKLARFLINERDSCLDNPTETVALYRSAKMSANLYRREHSDGGTDLGWAIGPREVELAACGTFMLRESRGEGDELFPLAPTFRTPAEFGDLIRYWKDNDDQRAKIAAANREAIADRTFLNATARLLQLIDGAPKRVAV